MLALWFHVNKVPQYQYETHMENYQQRKSGTRSTYSVHSIGRNYEQPFQRRSSQRSRNQQLVKASLPRDQYLRAIIILRIA